MRSVLIGFEYPIRDTPHFYGQISYRDLCGGVADGYTLSRFHGNLRRLDLPAVRYFKRADAVVVNDDPLMSAHSVLLRMVHVNVVYQFRYHALGDRRHVGIAPDGFKELVKTIKRSRWQGKQTGISRQRHG